MENEKITSFLVDLNGGGISLKTNDLSDQLVVAYADLRNFHVSAFFASEKACALPAQTWLHQTSARRQRLHAGVSGTRRFARSCARAYQDQRRSTQLHNRSPSQQSRNQQVEKYWLPAEKREQSTRGLHDQTIFFSAGTCLVSFHKKKSEPTRAVGSFTLPAPQARKRA